MAFRNYLEGEDDKPYFHLNSLAHYYDKMAGYALLMTELAEYIKGYEQTITLTKEQLELRLTQYISENKIQLEERLAKWDENLQTFEATATGFMKHWAEHGGIDELISTGLLDFRNAVSEVVYSKNLLNVNDSSYLKGQYMNPTTGDVLVNATYDTTGFLDVIPGKKIIATAKRLTDGSEIFTMMRFITCFKGSVLAPTLGNSSDVTTFIIPPEVTRVRVSFVVRTDITNQMINQTDVNDSTFPAFESYFKPYSRIITETDKTLLKENMAADSKAVGEALTTLKQVGTPYKNPTTSKKSESLPANASLALTDFPQMLKNGQRFTYSAKMTSLGTGQSVKIGFINSIYTTYQSWLEITHTHVKWMMQGTTDILDQAHGLSISDFLNVTVNIRADTARLELIITTVGGVYTFKQLTDSTRYNAIGHITALSTVPTSKIVLSATCTQFKKETWLIGDSYFGDFATRVGGRLNEWGYASGVLIDGVGGLDSQRGYEELQKLLKYGTPKTLVWYLGMNDTPATVSTYFPLVEKICADKGINLIFNRIPFVPSRLVQNKAVNDYVMASGKRYVDSYSAVGADGNGNWYPSHLDPDMIHPASLGAAALTGKLLADVPEILI